MAKRILILTADAGFGHRRASEAVEAALLDLYDGQCRVIVVNPMHDPAVPELIKRLEQGYDSVVTDDPALYLLAYSATDAPVVARLMQDAATTVFNQTLAGLVTQHQPDVILTTYPAFTQAAIRITQSLAQPVPVDVVVTDLIGVHSLWFHKDVSLTFVPTGQVYKQALDHGLDKSRIHLTGLPVQPAIARETRDKATIRRSLGWDVDRVTALIVGSARSRQTAAIAHLLDRSGLGLQIVAVAGGDQETEAQLKTIEWKSIVHTYGLVRNLPEMMHAADFIVCKAGGLIVSEALACGLPLILYEALPGQEIGNLKYVEDSGAGVWSPGPIGVLTTAYAWLAGDQAELHKARAAAQRIGKPRAAYDVAERVGKQIGLT